MIGFLTTLFFMTLSFFGTAVVMAQDENLSELARPVLDAVLSGDYMYAAAAGLVLLVALVRRYGGAAHPFLASKKFAPVLVLIGAVAAALGTAVSAGASLFDVKVLWGAIKVAVAASGSYVFLKAALDPVIARLKAHTPDKLKFIYALLEIVVQSGQKAQEAAIKKAVKAGDKAVAVQPSLGIDLKFDDID